jgi:hypothetical protein
VEKSHHLATKKFLYKGPLGIRARNFEDLLRINDEQPSCSHPKD